MGIWDGGVWNTITRLWDYKETLEKDGLKTRSPSSSELNSQSSLYKLGVGDDYLTPSEYTNLRLHQLSLRVDLAPHYVSLLAVTILVLTVGHVNRITRIVMSHSPLPYIIAADIMTLNRGGDYGGKDAEREDGDGIGWDKKFMVAWGSTYALIGGIAWMANLPFV